MKDEKHKKFSKVLVFIGLGMLVVILVIRLVATSQKDKGGLTQVNIPDEDVALPVKESKIDQFEKDEKKKLAETYKPSENLLGIQKDFETGTGNNNTSPTNNTIPPQNTTPLNFTTNPETKNQAPHSDLYNEFYGKESVTNKEQKNKTNEPKQVEMSEETITKQNVFGTVYSGNNQKIAAAKDMYKAVIHSDQNIANGQSAVFRNTEEIVLPDGMIIPINSILYGQAEYTGDRVVIMINRAIKGNKEEMVVDLQVYDNDFIQGVYFKSAVDKGVENAKDNSIDQVINASSVNVITKLGAKLIKGAVQGANETFKSNRKLKLEEGYIVYLKPGKKYRK